MPYLTPRNPQNRAANSMPLQKCKRKTHDIQQTPKSCAFPEETEKHQEYEMQLQKEAIAPHRGQIGSLSARERSPQETDGTKLVRNRTCTNEILLHPPIKVLLELERTSSFSKATVSPVPPRIIPNPASIAFPVRIRRSRDRCRGDGRGIWEARRDSAPGRPRA